MCVERKRKTAICHRPERRMDRASTDVECLIVALEAVERTVLIHQVFRDTLLRKSVAAMLASCSSDGVKVKGPGLN